MPGFISEALLLLEVKQTGAAQVPYPIDLWQQQQWFLEEWLLPQGWVSK